MKATYKANKVDTQNNIEDLINLNSIKRMYSSQCDQTLRFMATNYFQIKQNKKINVFYWYILTSETWDQKSWQKTMEIKSELIFSSVVNHKITKFNV